MIPIFFKLSQYNRGRPKGTLSKISLSTLNEKLEELTKLLQIQPCEVPVPDNQPVVVKQPDTELETTIAWCTKAIKELGKSYNALAKMSLEQSIQLKDLNTRLNNYVDLKLSPDVNSPADVVINSNSVKEDNEKSNESLSEDGSEEELKSFFNS